MSSSAAWRYLNVTVLALWLGASIAVPQQQTRGGENTQSVPKASCGPQDRTESGLQGQTTLAERFSSGPKKAYNCNLELVGQFEGEGSGFDMKAFDKCTYYSTWQHPQMQHPGVVVLDVSNSRTPQATAYLQGPAMLDAVHSLEFDQTRKLLFASKFTFDPQGVGTFDIYDLSTDCRHPILKSSFHLPGVQTHTGQFTRDGRIFYGASYATRTSLTPPAPRPAVFALDASDPTKLDSIAMWTPPKEEWRTHGVSVSQDGTRAYVVLTREADDRARSSDANGLVIFDVSDIQARRHQPQFRLISTLFWDDSHWAELALPTTIQGRQYLIWTDVLGTIPLTGSPPADACDSSRPGHGFARIIDIGDEAHPKTISKLMLEVHDPANCTKVMHDPVLAFGYGSVACDVDNRESARLLACGYFEAGLRVFDIRDPVNPKEIGYYKPRARRTESRPGSPFFLQSKSQTGPETDHTADAVISPKFHGAEIWFNSHDNGFQVVRFTDAFRASHVDLFKDRSEYDK